jgi:histidinol-phosphate/aromatic aminotransferase/cobyric acid decarboxylase-like protein
MSSAELTGAIAKEIRTNSRHQHKALERLKLKMVANTGLFHLIEHHEARSLYEGLARQRILTRVFSDTPDWLRLGLCKNDAERQRLSSALHHCLETA